MTEGTEVPISDETGPFAVEQAGGLLRRLAYQVSRTAKSPRASEVHDLRVAIRRFTQALAAFDSCFSTQEVKKIKRRMKKLMGIAGELRDCDIALDLLSRFKSTPSALVASIRKRRQEAEGDLTAALRRWSQRRTYSKWRAVLERPGRSSIGHDPIAITVAHTLQPMLREFLDRGKRALSPTASVKSVHRLRIEAKKLRYTVELFVHVDDASLDGWLERLRALQNVLGVVSDCGAALAMIEREGGDRRIQSALRRKARRKLDEFRRLWADSFSDAWMDLKPRKPAASGGPRALRLAAG